MTSSTFVTDACVMSKGQVTIPKKVRAVLGIEPGDRVTFIVENGTVRVENSSIYALQRFQKEMQGEAEKSGLFSEEDIANWILNSRESEANK